jgi:hypothetical protein
MKRIVVGALAALLLALPAGARAQGDVEWGVKGGLTVSGLRGADGIFDSKRGAVFGAYGVFDFAPEFGVEIDALFSMKGGKLTGRGLDESGSVVAISQTFFVLDYIEFPILARLNAPSYVGITPHVYAGPTIAFKAGARGIFPGATRDLDAARSIDSGIAVGASADLPIGTRALVVDGRWDIGLTNAFNWAGPDLKNDTFSLMVGVSF